MVKINLVDNFFGHFGKTFTNGKKLFTLPQLIFTN